MSDRAWGFGTATVALAMCVAAAAIVIAIRQTPDPGLPPPGCVILERVYRGPEQGGTMLVPIVIPERFSFRLRADDGREFTVPVDSITYHYYSVGTRFIR